MGKISKINITVFKLPDISFYHKCGTLPRGALADTKTLTLGGLYAHTCLLTALGAHQRNKKDDVKKSFFIRGLPSLKLGALCADKRIFC